MVHKPQQVVHKPKRTITERKVKHNKNKKNKTMKVIDVINVYSALTVLNIGKVAKAGKFEILDCIDALSPTVEQYNKQQDEAVKMLADKGELSDRLWHLQQQEVNIEVPKICSETFESILESNEQMTAGVCAALRRTIVK